MFRHTSHSLPVISLFWSYYWNTSLCVSRNNDTFFLFHSMNNYQQQAAITVCSLLLLVSGGNARLPVDVRVGYPPSRVAWWGDVLVMLCVSFPMQYLYPSFIKLFDLYGFVLDSKLHSLPWKSWRQWNPPQIHNPPERTYRAVQKGGHEEYSWAFSPSHRKAQQTPMDLDWHFKSCCFHHFLKCCQRWSHISRCEDPQLPAQMVLEGRGGWKAAVLCWLQRLQGATRGIKGPVSFLGKLLMTMRWKSDSIPKTCCAAAVVWRWIQLKRATQTVQWIYLTWSNAWAKMQCFALSIAIAVSNCYSTLFPSMTMSFHLRAIVFTWT